MWTEWGEDREFSLNPWRQQINCGGIFSRSLDTYYPSKYQLQLRIVSFPEAFSLPSSGVSTDFENVLSSSSNQTNASFSPRVETSICIPSKPCKCCFYKIQFHCIPFRSPLIRNSSNKCIQQLYTNANSHPYLPNPIPRADMSNGRRVRWTTKAGIQSNRYTTSEEYQISLDPGQLGLISR